MMKVKVFAGYFAKDMFHYGLCAQWMKVALETDKLDHVTSIEGYMTKGECHYHMGDYDSAAKSVQMAKELDPENAMVLSRFWQYRNTNETASKEGYKSPTTAITWKKTEPDWKTNYMRLCRGDEDAIVS